MPMMPPCSKHWLPFRRLGYNPKPLLQLGSPRRSLTALRAACRLAKPRKKAGAMGAALVLALVAEIIDIVLDHQYNLPWRITSMVLQWRQLVFRAFQPTAKACNHCCAVV